MKRLQRLLSALVVVALLAMSMTITAFADDAPKGKIVLNNDKADTNVSIAGQTYSAYKVFDLVQNEDHTTYAYTLATAFETLFDGTAFTTAFPVATYGTVDGDSTSSIYAFVSSLNTSAKIEKFADYVNDFVETNSITATKTATAAATTGTKEAATFTGLDLGYYLIYGEAQSLDNSSDVVTACILDTTTYKDATDGYMVSIDVKVGVPTVDKNIVDSTDALVKADSASIGETVKFEVDSEVPNLTGYTAYTLTMTDKMSEGLTYNADMVVKIGTDTIDASEYTVTTSTDTDNNTIITVEFDDFYTLAKTANYAQGAQIQYLYSAKVNDKAVIGATGNPNSAKITYSNDPDADTTNDTPDSEVKVYTFQYNVYKYTDNGTPNTPLENAEFELRKNSATAAAIQFVKDAAGNYRVATAEEIADADTTKYTTIVSDADGNINVTGLGKGTYYLKETKAPDGYNLLEEDIVAKITPVYDTTDATALNKLADPATGAQYTNLADKSGIKSEVENTTGVELPSTGGMGTTIFYVIGGLMIAMAGIAFMARKLRRREE